MYQKTNNCYDIRNLTRNYGSENFWYEIAVHLLKNKYFKHLQKNEKKIVQVKRNDLVNMQKVYGTEQNFISSKILRFISSRITSSFYWKRNSFVYHKPRRSSCIAHDLLPFLKIVMVSSYNICFIVLSYFIHY